MLEKRKGLMMHGIKADNFLFYDFLVSFKDLNLFIIIIKNLQAESEVKF